MFVNQNTYKITSLVWCKVFVAHTVNILVWGCPHHHWRCKLPLTVARTHEKILNLQHIGLPRQPETDSRVSEEIHLVEQYQEQVSDLKKSSLILDEMFIIIHSWGVWYSHQLLHSWYWQIALWYGSYIEEIGCQSPFQIRRLSTLHSRGKWSSCSNLTFQHLIATFSIGWHFGSNIVLLYMIKLICLKRRSYLSAAVTERWVCKECHWGLVSTETIECLQEQYNRPRQAHVRK